LKVQELQKEVGTTINHFDEDLLYLVNSFNEQDMLGGGYNYFPRLTEKRKRDQVEALLYFVRKYYECPHPLDLLLQLHEVIASIQTSTYSSHLLENSSSGLLSRLEKRCLKNFFAGRHKNLCCFWLTTSDLKFGELTKPLREKELCVRHELGAFTEWEGESAITPSIYYGAPPYQYSEVIPLAISNPKLYEILMENEEITLPETYENRGSHSEPRLFSDDLEATADRWRSYIQGVLSALPFVGLGSYHWSETLQEYVLAQQLPSKLNDISHLLKERQKTRSIIVSASLMVEAALPKKWMLLYLRSFFDIEKFDYSDFDLSFLEEQ